jgi:hypothetical protein
MADLECPYCEKELYVNHDDGFGYDEGVKHEMECDHCGKRFVFETVISFDYYPDCPHYISNNLVDNDAECGKSGKECCYDHCPLPDYDWKEKLLEWIESNYFYFDSSPNGKNALIQKIKEM